MRYACCRWFRLVLTVAAVVTLGWVVPLHAQGPPPLVNLVDAGEQFLIYVLCPVAAVWFIAKAAMKAAEGHHGGGGGVVGPVVSAVVLISITVVRSWMRSL